MKFASILKKAVWVAVALIGLLFLGLQVVDWYWRPFMVVNVLKTLSSGLYDYYDKHGSYPPDHIDGQLSHSWRVRVLQEIYPPEEETNSSRTLEKYDFTKSWEDVSNRRAARKLLGPRGEILAFKLPNGDWLARDFAAARRKGERLPAPALLVYWAGAPYSSNQPGDLVWDGESDSLTIGGRQFPLTALCGKRLIRPDGAFDVLPEHCDLQTVKAILLEQQW